MAENRFLKVLKQVPAALRRKSERGQILIMVAGAAIVLFAMTGLAIDFGRMYMAKAQLSRAVDAAALAGVLEFNGQSSGLANAQAKALEYIEQNEPEAEATVVPDGVKNELTVDATKTINTYFLSVLGITSTTVRAHAKAGFGTLTVDAALVIDATGSMSGDPINNAKQAAISFKNVLLGSAPSGNVVVGVTPFRGCFRANPQTEIAPKPMGSTYCVDYAAQTTYLMYDSAALQSRITAISAQGGSGTNVCGGLYMGLQILDGPNNHNNPVLYPNNKRYLVLLSDGDNTYNSYSYQSSPASPYSSCRPNTSPGSSDTYVDSNCRSAQTREREVDVKTYQLAQSLKSQGIEIFVVGFGVCDPNSGPVYSSSQCSAQIGNTDHDNTADERLLKCIASSKPGTNDHYYWASSASQLPAIFTAIANQIAHRLIE